MYKVNVFDYKQDVVLAWMNDMSCSTITEILSEPTQSKKSDRVLMVMIEKIAYD